MTTPHQRSRRPDRVPTEEELNQYDVSDEEEAEYRAYIERVRVALVSARIPPTLDWAMVMVIVASKLLMVQGMGPEYFIGLAKTCWEANAQAYDRAFVDGFLDPRALGNVSAKSVRLRGALTKAKLSTTSDMTAMALLSHACRALSAAGVPIALFEHLCRGLYEDSERELAKAIAIVGAKA